MTTPPPGGLKQRVIRAGVWSFAGYGASQVIRLASSLIMTRLLAPDMFGVMAIAGMITVILSLLSDMGLRQNIVQSKRGDDPVFLDTAWVVQIVRGFALWFAALLVSAGLYHANATGRLPGGSVYSAAILPFVIAAHSFAAVIVGFQSTKIATAHRSFNQKRLAQAELIAQLTGLCAMIVLAWVDRSIWALVAGGLVTSFTIMVLSHVWMSGHQNRFRCDRSALRELAAFGKWIFASSALYVLVSNGDRLLLGMYVDAGTLGLYSIAALLVGAAQSALSRFSTTVTLPALSEIARTNRPRLREIYYRLRLPGDVALLLMAGFLSAAGSLLIDALYDPRYSSAGAILQILSLSLFTTRYDLAQQNWLALGMTRYLTIINVVRFASLYILVPALYLLGGTQAAIWGIALHALPTLPFVFAFNARLGLNNFLRETAVLICMPTGFLCGWLLTLIRI